MQPTECRVSSLRCRLRCCSRCGDVFVLVLFTQSGGWWEVSATPRCASAARTRSSCVGSRASRSVRGRWYMYLAQELMLRIISLMCVLWLVRSTVSAASRRTQLSELMWVSCSGLLQGSGNNSSSNSRTGPAQPQAEMPEIARRAGAPWRAARCILCKRR